MNIAVEFRCTPMESQFPVEVREIEVEAPNFVEAAKRGEMALRDEGEFQRVDFTGRWQAAE